MKRPTGLKAKSDEFAALTYCWRDKDKIINYIKKQQEHHKRETFEEELRRIFKEQGIVINEKYFP
jgi:putative transposase